MTPAIASAAPIVPTPTALEPVDSFNPTDLDRLRELIASTASQTANPQGIPGVADATALDGVAKTQGRSLGDSILEGVLKFGSKYEASMNGIQTRLEGVVKSEGTGLTNFSEILALQIDVSKWSMSVMGVDNASKAGSNTIKELSHGG